MTLVALAGGSSIFLAVIVLVLVGLIYRMFTRAVSGIDHHPHDGSDGAVGAKGPSETSGRNEGDGSALGDHRTR
jgi:hypothetical protein